MKLAFLFNFFDDTEVCKNRLRMLKKFNPDIPIYGLYGGDVSRAGYFQKHLGAMMDDLYVFNENDDPVWRWVNMDLLLNSWYKTRGRELDWDTVIFVHWDQLILAPINELFPHYNKGELLLPGLRPISDVEDWWSWLAKDREPYGYNWYQTFLDYVKSEFQYADQPPCFQGLLCFFPRDFLEKFSQVPHIEHGYIEYRVSIYAQIFKTPICTNHIVDCWWPEDPERDQYTERHMCMHASKDAISLKSILDFQKQAGGPRLFHPFRRLYPLSARDWFKIFRDKCLNHRQSRKHIKLN